MADNADISTKSHRQSALQQLAVQARTLAELADFRATETSGELAPHQIDAFVEALEVMNSALLAQNADLADVVSVAKLNAGLKQARVKATIETGLETIGHDRKALRSSLSDDDYLQLADFLAGTVGDLLTVNVGRRPSPKLREKDPRKHADELRKYRATLAPIVTGLRGYVGEDSENPDVTRAQAAAKSGYSRGNAKSMAETLIGLVGRPELGLANSKSVARALRRNK